MNVELVIPRLGRAKGAILVEWLRGDGEFVSPGEAVVRLQYERNWIDLISPCCGSLRVEIPAGNSPLQIGTRVGHVRLSSLAQDPSAY